MDILEAAGEDCLPRYLLTERERRSDDTAESRAGHRALGS